MKSGWHRAKIPQHYYIGDELGHGEVCKVGAYWVGKNLHTGKKFSGMKLQEVKRLVEKSLMGE